MAAVLPLIRRVEWESSSFVAATMQTTAENDDVAAATAAVIRILENLIVGTVISPRRLLFQLLYSTILYYIISEIRSVLRKCIFLSGNYSGCQVTGFGAPTYLRLIDSQRYHQINVNYSMTGPNKKWLIDHQRKPGISRVKFLHTVICHAGQRALPR